MSNTRVTCMYHIHTHKLRTSQHRQAQHIHTSQSRMNPTHVPHTRAQHTCTPDHLHKRVITHTGHACGPPVTHAGRPCSGHIVHSHSATYTRVPQSRRQGKPYTTTCVHATRHMAHTTCTVHIRTSTSLCRSTGDRKHVHNTGCTRRHRVSHSPHLSHVT